MMLCGVGEDTLRDVHALVEPGDLPHLGRPGPPVAHDVLPRARVGEDQLVRRDAHHGPEASVQLESPEVHAPGHLARAEGEGARAPEQRAGEGAQRVEEEVVDGADRDVADELRLEG